MIKIVLVLIILCQFVSAEKEKNRDGKLLSFVDNKLFYQISDLTGYLTGILADYNDRNLGKSEWGRMLGYEEIKPKLPPQEARGVKKMSMAMMPLVFHVGATSTWMLITSIMAAKSVAIGLLLLVFKIAVSSAKVASFFTLLKSKHSEHHPTYSWTPHGHDRSLSNKEIPIHDEWSSYTPEWVSSDFHSTGYKTIPSYKENSISSHYEEFADTEIKADKKYDNKL